MIPPRAMQILDKLNEMFPELFFEWENKEWPLLDSTSCTLIVYQKSNPSNRATMHCSGGVSEHTVEEHIDGIVNHLIPKIKK